MTIINKIVLRKLKPKPKNKNRKRRKMKKKKRSLIQKYSPKLIKLRTPPRTKTATSRSQPRTPATRMNPQL